MNSGLKSLTLFVNLGICQDGFCLGFKNHCLKLRYQNLKYSGEKHSDANNLKSSQ